MSFDLSVWALPGGARDEDVRAGVQRCRQGQHLDRHPDPRLVGFYRAITATYPDRHPGPDTPWAVTPLHAAHDHIELNLHPTCEDQVLLDIERLAGEHDLMLYDAQDGTVYPPPARVQS